MGFINDYEIHSCQEIRVFGSILPSAKRLGHRNEAVARNIQPGTVGLNQGRLDAELVQSPIGLPEQFHPIGEDDGLFAFL
jgi:hypothetical protein